MPYKCEKIKIEGTVYDARKKIDDETRKEILACEGVLSQRKTASKFGISRKMVVFIWYPEKLKRAKELYKIRRLDGRYYKKDLHTKQMKKHRRRKYKLYKEGLINLIEEENEKVSKKV